MSEPAGASEPWDVERHLGSAVAFHSRSLVDPVRRSIWWFTIEGPALVLGSTQPDTVVDRRAATAAGVDVVRRRSGGGAVLLVPGATTWVDVVIPSADPLWQSDVGRAFDWLGESWAATLTSLGVASCEVHRGPPLRTWWSDLVCFAGVGRGEIVADGHKILGISQRRSRGGARFQCALSHRWDAPALLQLLALDREQRERAAGELPEVAAGVLGALPPAELERAFLRELPH